MTKEIMYQCYNEETGQTVGDAMSYEDMLNFFQATIDEALEIEGEVIDTLHELGEYLEGQESPFIIREV